MLKVIGQLTSSAFFGRRRARLMAEAAARPGLLAAAPEAVALPQVQRYEAAGPSGPYAVFVAVPVTPPPAAGYPVLTMLDGNAWIASAAEALNWQARFASQSEIDPPLIVAVGYPGESAFDIGRRAYDFLPKHKSGKIGERFMQGAPWHQPGGAEAFLDFLAGPLRSDIAVRYPVNPARHILYGHSFGGRFALQSFLTRPTKFAAYAALSPSLWWDDGQLMKDADTLIAALPRELAAHVLIGVGGRETPDRPEISARMLAEAEDMAQRIRTAGPPGVVLQHKVWADENHQSLPTAALSTVLRFTTAAGAS